MSADSPGGSFSDASSRHPQWSAVLDELESQLDDAERTLTSVGPPAGGPGAPASDPSASDPAASGPSASGPTATGTTATGTTATGPTPTDPTATDPTATEAMGISAPDHRVNPFAAPRPWTPPTGLGPMPAALSDRASSVLARQSVLVARLVEARSAVQQQLGVVRRVEASHEPGRPVYLDTLG